MKKESAFAIAMLPSIHGPITEEVLVNRLQRLVSSGVRVRGIPLRSRNHRIEIRNGSVFSDSLGDLRNSGWILVSGSLLGDIQQCLRDALGNERETEELRDAARILKIPVLTIKDFVREGGKRPYFVR